MTKNSLKLIFYIFSIFHLIPFLYLLNRKEYVSNFYRGEIGSLWTILYALSFFIMVYFFSRIKFKNISFKRLEMIFSKKPVLLLSCLFLFLSVFFFQNYGLNFRQSSKGLSSGGGVLFMHLIIKNYVKILLFIELIYQYNFKRFYLSRSIKFILLTSLALSISGSLDIILISYFLLTLFIPKLIISMKSFKSLLLLGFMLVSIVFVGIANKIGVSETSGLFKLENFIILFEHFLRRISTWHQSIEVVGKEFLFSFERSQEIISNILKNTFSRLQILFGNNFEKPKIWSLSRYNYLLLFQNNTNATTGSSPGIVASSQLLFPFSFVLLSFGLGQLIRSISSLFGQKTNLLFDIFLILVILYPILSSPIDLINIFGPGVVFLFLLLISISYLKNNYSKLK